MLQPSSQGGWYSPPHRVVVEVDVVVVVIVDVDVVDVVVVVVYTDAVALPTTACSVLSVE